MSKLAVTVLLAAIGLALAGCAGAGGKQTATTASKAQTTASQTHASAPRPVRIVQAPRVHLKLLRGHGAAFLSPTRLAFFTSGSSNCRAVPATLAVETPDTIRIQLKNEMPPNQICLTDLVIEPVVIAIAPKQINVHHRLTIRRYYPLTSQPVLFTAPPLS